ncbi:MAG: 50S ribosomal protein L15 [Candidatus Omnitrophica bacterium]|nr:50S ribosomal protein L15 [Candidatus Omnitrophota bacterium]
MKIENIRKPKGASKAPKRVGRGAGSGWGKTAGRGHKGAKARSGATRRLGFEGGQMPLIRRLPKVGFTHIKKKVYQIINVENLNCFKKDSSVDKKAMKEARLIKRTDALVKILGDGKLSKSLSIMADAFSKSAKKKITDAGGKIGIAKK